MVKQPRIVAAKTLSDYTVEIKFTTGEVGQVNLRDWIVGCGGIFAPMEDVSYFARVEVNPEFGTIQWPNGVDFCPDVLYTKTTGKPLPFSVKAKSSL